MRDDHKLALKKVKQQINAFCLRHGYHCIFRSMKSTCTGKQVHSLGETGPLSRRRSPLLKEGVPLPFGGLSVSRAEGTPSEYQLVIRNWLTMVAKLRFSFFRGK